jgi:hypothetical protein
MTGFRLTAPVIPESDIHAACRDVLDRLLMPPAMWFPYPAGVTDLAPWQLAAFQRFGLKRGMPDLWVFFNGVYCVELKRIGGRLSKTKIARTRRGSPRVLVGQEEVFPQLLASGGVKDIAIAHSVDEMLGHLMRWQIPLRPHHWKPTPPPLQKVNRGRLQ